MDTEPTLTPSQKHLNDALIAIKKPISFDELKIGELYVATKNQSAPNDEPYTYLPTLVKIISKNNDIVECNVADTKTGIFRRTSYVDKWDIRHYDNDTYEYNKEYVKFSIPLIDRQAIFNKIFNKLRKGGKRKKTKSSKQPTRSRGRKYHSRCSKYCRKTQRRR